MPFFYIFDKFIGSNLMSKQLMFILAVLLLLIEGTFAQNKEIRKIDGSTILSHEIDKVVEHLMDTANVTGLGLTIFNNNKIVYQKAFGISNAATGDTLREDSIFYGASLSKAVFSIVVMQFIEEGLLSLDTPLQNYLDKPLPDYKKFATSQRGFHHLKGDKRYETITARMCLAHTTGFPNWRFLTSEGFDANGRLYFQSDPGARYSYSGEGIFVLQFVLEQITGKGLEEIAQERIFKPLGMNRTSYIYVLEEELKSQYAFGHNKNQEVIPFDQADEAGAAGSMGTTLADYSKFLAAVLNQQLLQKASYDEIFEKQVTIKSKQQFGTKAFVETNENEDIALGYGVGWGLLETPYGRGAFKEGHSEGYEHYSIIFPEIKSGILIMTNSANGESIFKELLQKAIGDNFTPWQWQNYIPYDSNPDER